MKEKISSTLKKVRKNVVEYIITNRLFVSYVLLSILGTMLVRKFTIGSFFGLNPFITDLGLILIIGAFGYFIRPKNQFRYYFIWIIIFTTINIVSSIYYTFYISFASFGELATVGQVETVSGSIFEKLRFVDIMYVFVPVIFYFVHRKLSQSTYYYFIDKIEKGKKMVASTILVGALCVGYSFGVASGSDYSRLAKQWNRIYIVERFGIIMYQFNDLIQTLTPRINSMFGHDEALEKFNAYFDKQEEHADNKYTGILKGYNIVFVHMESIQNFLMDLEFNGEEVTPNLNDLSSDGMFFSNFYPQVSTGTSSDTEFTLLSGLMPAASGTVFVSYFDRNYFTIPKYLKEQGYYTFSMHGNYSSMWNRYRAHPSLGYEGMYYEESFEYTPEDVINLGINDYLFFQQGVGIMEKIENTYDNYMGTIITLSNHSPFNLASSHSTLDLSSTFSGIDEITGLSTTKTTDYLSSENAAEYIKSANYADGALGALLDYIKESDEFNNTLFVFYGDHDAKLSRSEINTLYNFNPKNGELYTEEDEEYVNYDYYDHELNKKTPLIMWSKNKDLRRTFRGEIDYTMGMYDVAPTILNMFGINNKYIVGSDIFNSKDGNMVIYPNGNILTNKVYYNNSTGEYKVLQKNAVIEEDYIQNIVSVAEEKLEVSNNIIVYNLLDSVKIED